MKMKIASRLVFGLSLIVVYAVAFVSSLPALEKELKGILYGTSEQKLALIDRVVNMGAKESLPVIADSLFEDEDDEVRSRMALALVELGDRTYGEYFKRLLGDSYWQVRLYGIKGLVKYAASDIIPVLFDALETDSYWQVRYYAAEGLGKYGDESALKRAITCLKDSNKDVQKRLLWSIRRLMWRDESRAMFKSLSMDDIRPLLSLLESSDTGIRIRALWFLSSTGDGRLVPHIVSMLDDESDEVKIRAVWVLESFKAEEAGEAIEALLADEKVNVKIEGIKTLVKLQVEESLPGIISNLNSSEEEEVRLYALWALKKFANPASYPAVVGALADESAQIRDYALNFIKDNADPVFVPVLQGFFTDTEKSLDARLEALSLTGLVGDAGVIPFLIQQTRSDFDSIRLTAVRAAYNADKLNKDFLSILPYLERYDDSMSVRREVSVILRGVMETIGEMLKSPDSQQREAALDRVVLLSGARRLPDLLIRMSNSKYPEVQEKMLLLVAEEKDKIFAGDVRRLFRESDIEMRKLAAIALGAMEDRGAIPMLQQGLKHMDFEFQLICAWALAKMGDRSGFSHAVSYIDSDNIEYQKRAAEILAFLRESSSSGLLLRRMQDAELDVKVICAWALARMGDEKGLEALVRLSLENVEPVRTRANRYLSDTAIPLSLRSKVASIREDLYFEKLGISEVSRKIIYAERAAEDFDVGGPGYSSFWVGKQQDERFILLSDEKILAQYQTRVSVGYSDKNLYMLFICSDPKSQDIGLESREFITIAINPLNSFGEWYQFILHPKSHIHYSYVWKFYGDEDEDASSWESEWSAVTTIQQGRWVAEVVIPLSDIKSEDMNVWSINFQRDSEHTPQTTWTGRIDNPEQFGLLIFKE